MKLLHTSDLHIGKRFNGVNLIDDQKYALEQICDIAVEKECDMIVIAGDVYDRINPSAEAMALFDSFLLSLSEKKIPVYIISGNHDSQQRVAYLSGLVRTNGIYISDSCSGTLETYSAADEYGEIRIHLLPFIKPVEVKRVLPDAKIETYDDAVRTVINNTAIDTSVRNVIVCHQYVDGASLCDSEERPVGGLDNISADIFNKFDYAAMGHIHGPQHIKRPELRYSGSPLKYSFSEASHRKSVTIAELREKGNTIITTVPLSSIHDVREVRGRMDELMNMPYSEDYVRVTVTEENVAPDARVSLLTVFPNMMRFAVENYRTGGIIEKTITTVVEKKSPEELFSDFYRLMNNDEAPSQEHITLLKKVMERLGETGE